MKGVTRRDCLVALAAGLTGSGLAGAWPAAASPASSVSFPHQKPVSLWVPWAAGGATDIALRLLAELAGVHLGQRIVVENRGGAGGTLVMPVLQQAEPDGYTIAQIPQPVLRAPHTQAVLWDPIRDVTPIIQVSGVTFGVITGASGSLRSLDDLFAYARAKPGALSIATNGVGTTPHVVLEELFTARGLRYIHLPYKGVAELQLAVESGQVMAGVSATGFAPAVDAGRLRLLATFAAKRSPRWPAVPTLKDLGFNIVAMSPYGLGGPRNLPPAIVAALHDAFKKAMFEKAFMVELAKYDQEVAYLGTADYAHWLRDEYQRERQAAERMGLLRAGA
jgi:tripartite-type tricarboxylate transporter receptor subunit TctC